MAEGLNQQREFSEKDEKGGEVGLTFIQRSVLLSLSAIGIKCYISTLQAILLIICWLLLPSKRLERPI